jgi:hypothetical protein
MGEYIQSAEWIGPNPISCGFDSRLAYSVPIRSTGRTLDSGSGNRGSNPRWAATPL